MDGAGKGYPARSMARISHLQTAHPQHVNRFSRFFLSRFCARILHPFRHASPPPSAAQLARARELHAEAVARRWLAGRATWDEMLRAQAQVQAVGGASTPSIPVPVSVSLPPRQWPAVWGGRAEEATELAQAYGVVAQEIDRRSAPSASGDRLFIAVVQWSATGERGGYAPGSKWVVRIRRHHPEQISCACGGALPQGSVCGHVGAVLLLVG